MAKGYVQITVDFPQDLVTKIYVRAQQEGRSFSETVVKLCEIGDFDLSDSDHLEPDAKVQ